MKNGYKQQLIYVKAIKAWNAHKLEKNSKDATWINSSQDTVYQMKKLLEGSLTQAPVDTPSYTLSGWMFKTSSPGVKTWDA